MKNSKLLPLTLFALTMVLVTTGCSPATVGTPQPQIQEPAPIESSEPHEVRYGDIVIGQQCQDECFNEMLQVVEKGNLDLWDLQTCHMACETAGE